jgi:hypothetical protein
MEFRLVGVFSFDPFDHFVNVRHLQTSFGKRKSAFSAEHDAAAEKTPLPFLCF